MVIICLLKMTFVVWLRLHHHPHYLPSDVLYDEKHHPSGSESVRDENEPLFSDSITPVSSSSPTVSHSLASARMTLSK